MSNQKDMVGFSLDQLSYVTKNKTPCVPEAIKANIQQAGKEKSNAEEQRDIKVMKQS
jgi:hypothetical protein